MYHEYFENMRNFFCFVKSQKGDIENEMINKIINLYRKNKSIVEKY